jgi:hypothetical protein
MQCVTVANWRAVVGILLALLRPGVAWGGMPTVRLHEVARLRMEVISFFLLGLLASAVVVALVWNGLRRDFPRLPRLSFGRALGVVVLWGLLFIVVLTMISGARELMTPGAWEPRGWTYQLREEPTQEASDDAVGDVQRRQHVARLSEVLGEFADAHEGGFPDAEQWQALPVEARSLPELVGMTYVYLPGRHRSGEPRLLAYEPEVFDGELFALLTNGEIQRLEFAEIMRLRMDDES